MTFSAPSALARDQIRGAEIDVAHCRRKDDMHGLVVGNLQSVRRNHAVESEFARETVIEIAVPLRVGIDLFAERYRLRLFRRFDGLGVRYFLCVRRTHAQREGEHHYKNLFHFTVDLVVCGVRKPRFENSIGC